MSRFEYNDKYKPTQCNGCIYKQDSLYCMIADNGSIKNCPCKECLVKAMCKRQSICIIRVNYIAKIITNKAEEIIK